MIKILGVAVVASIVLIVLWANGAVPFGWPFWA